MVRKNIFYWIGILVAIVVINWPSVRGPYILDDNHTIVNNAHIQSLSSLGKIWTSGRYYSALPATWGYRPLTTAVTAVLWSVGGGQTWPFHVFKWFLFFFICFFTFKLWQRLLPQVSDAVLKITLLLFAINPVHSQLMGYISASSSLLATLFVVIAMHFYFINRETNKRSYHFISLTSAFLAIMSKEEGVVVIGLLIIAETYLNWKKSGKIVFANYKKLVGHIVVSAFGVFLIFYHFESTQNLVRTGITPWQYFMTQWSAYIRYMTMFVWSFDLNGDNLSFGFAKSFFEWKVLLALMFNLLLIGAALKKVRTQPIFLLVLLWFYASVAPSSSIIPLGEPVNDHRAMTAYVGMGLLLAMLLFQLKRWNNSIFWAFSLSLCIAYSTFSMQRAYDWGDRVSLWEDTVRKNPTSGRAYNNLATALIAKNEFRRSLEVINNCLNIASYYSYCHVNKAVILTALGEEKRVNAMFAKGVELDMHYVTSRLYWSQYLGSRGLLQKAKDLLDQADAFTSGNNIRVRVELIETLYRMGMTSEAAKLKEDSLARFGKKDMLMNIKPF